MILFSVTSSFLMKMVSDEMQKRCQGMLAFATKGRALVDLKSCPSAGDPDGYGRDSGEALPEALRV